MTPTNIRYKRERILKKIDNLNAELDALQTVCDHLNLTMENGSNTGNYDPSCNCYWTDYECPDCGKRWTEMH